ncbi:MAG: HIRAN domain-containing protein [Ruminococcus sp.]|nr:HIRAN domain-containing protein [Ruminococcus sp.]
MLKEIRTKVMQIANRLHYKSGLDRSTALAKAWRLIKTHAVSTRVAGTTFDNRQNVLAFLKSYQAEQVSIRLMRDRSNAFDKNAVAVIATVKGKVSAVIGYLPKAVADIVAVLMDKGLDILSDTLNIVGGYAGHENYGAGIIIRI